MSGPSHIVAVCDPKYIHVIHYLIALFSCSRQTHGRFYGQDRETDVYFISVCDSEFLV